MLLGPLGTQEPVMSNQKTTLPSGADIQQGHPDKVPANESKTAAGGTEPQGRGSNFMLALGKEALSKA